MSATAHSKQEIPVKFHEAQSFAVPVTFSPRIILVSVDTVRALRGCDAEAVVKTICNATHPRCLRWVFNVAFNPQSRTRALRFWIDDVRGFADKWADPQSVIDRILGQRQTFARSEIEVQWTVCAFLIGRLIKTGELAESNHRITRASLAEFLKRRLL